MSHGTRDRLIITAMRLFSEKGFGATSVADILGSAKVNSGSLYNFFPGKQELLLAVLDTYRDGINEMLLQPAWKGIADPIEKVFSLLAWYRRLVVDSECFYGCPIGSLALEFREPDPAVRERLIANFEVWISAVDECLIEAERHLRVSNRRDLAQFVLTTMEGAVMLARTYRDVSYFDRAVQELRNYFACLQRNRGPPGGSQGRRSTHKNSGE